MQFSFRKLTSNKKSLKERIFGRSFNVSKNLKAIKQKTKKWSFWKKKSFKVGATAFVTVSVIAITVFSLLVPGGQNGRLFAANGSWDQTTFSGSGDGTYTDVEAKNSNADVGLALGMTATGGTITSSGGYTIHTFTSSGTFTVTSGSGNVDYLTVAGGGGGGAIAGGGGGAGGLVTATDYAVTAQGYTVTVGAGGAGATIGTSKGVNGGNSQFGTTTAAVGGGGGGSESNTAGAAGGSGGGARSNTGAAGGAGTSGQGNTGGTNTVSPATGGGGGGGAGAVGQNGQASSGGGNGGVGIASSFSGASVYYAGGGGGGSNSTTTAGTGGNGGGGNGGKDLTTAATAGTANTGGGGGGGNGSGSGSYRYGAAGGSGVVIVRYLTTNISSGSFTSSTIQPTGLYGNWGALTFTKTTPAGTTLTVDVLNGASGATIQTDVASGTDLGLSTTTYPSLKLKANLACTTCTNTPLLNEWHIAHTYDTTAPSAPTNLNTGTVTNNTIPLTWDASTDAESGIAGYEVQRAPDSAGVPGSWANVASGPCSGVVATNSCSDTTVSPNTKYYYKVRAKDNEDNYSAYFDGKTEIDYMEYASDGTAQAAFVSNAGAAVTATGGTITTSGGYKIHSFTSSGTFTVSAGSGNAEILVVAGGGGGEGGGGGAGGYVYNSARAVSPNSYTVTVGAGGAGTTTVATNGSDSVFDASGAPITATGGGKGASYSAGGGNGGSGGGAARTTGTYSGGSGTQGSAGGAASTGVGGGGGGGYSQIGAVGPGGKGGDGQSNSITGVAVTYAGGGGGGKQTSGAGAGGAGGGGAGGSAGVGTAGTANTGGGGGGSYSTYGGAGGSGIVIIRYLDTLSFQAYSEATIKSQGSYALKGAATQTESLNTTLTRTISSPINLSDINSLNFDIRSTRTGSNIKVGIHDSGGTTTEITPNITSANAYQAATLDLSAVTNVNKDNIDQIIVTVANADANNTFYIDNMYGGGYVSATTLPEVPVLTAFTSPTTDSTPQIVGTTDVDLANLTIRLYDNGVLAATTTANGSGAYTFANGDYSTPFTEGAHTNITARSVNAESAESADSNALSITFDLQAPTTSLTSNPVAADGANGYFKTIPSITLTISDPAFSAGNGTTYYKWDGDGSFSSPSTYSAPIDMDLSIGQGTHTLYWKTTDTAGNVEASLNSQQFKLDSAMPNTLSISISGGSTYETLNPVTLTLSAADATSGMSEMQFSNDGVTYSSWEPYGTSPQSPWDLTDVTYGGTTDEGTKTVFVKFTDNAGNETTAISDSITLDTVAPTNPSSPATGEASPSDPTVLTTNNWYNYTTPKFTLSGATDATAGVSGYYVYWGNSSTGSPTVDGAFQAGNTYTPTITTDNSGKTYYLRVRSKDNAGNIYTNADASTYTLFTYKFDVTNPNPVDYISPTPAGWSATDSFGFTWPVATDVLANSASSGVQGYQYKKQPDSEWTLSNDNTLTGITSYQTGVNVLQVRTIDNAGNTSSTIPVNYYFSGNVAAPTGLAADISQSEAQTVNNYKFTWDAAAGAQGYYYSVNATPNTQNTTFTTDPLTAYGPFATNQGLNTFYVVTKDENGNTGWSNYAQVNFTCSTSAPGVPTSVTISDSSNRTTSQWALTITWKEPTTNTDDFDGYVVEKSVDGGSFATLATTASSTLGYLDTNLSNTTEYTYRVKAKDNTGNVSANSTEVEKTPTGRYTEPPAIIGSPSFNVKTTKADISFVTDREADSFVQVGTTSQYGMTQGQLDSVKTHKVALSGLTPGTTYHFRAMWRDSDGNIGYSNDQIFKTTDAAAISEVKVSDITLDSAVISWETNTVSTSTVKYGETSAYGSEINDESGSSTTIHTIKISELKDGTTYNFKIGGSDTEGSAISSDNYAFTTLPKPRLTNIAYEQVKESAIPTLKINWESNVPVSSTVNVFENGRGIPKEVAKALLETKHALTMTNLKDNTSYTMIVKGRDAYGNEATSDTISFKTALDSRPPLISNITVESSLLGFGVDAKGQLVVSWETDEMTTSQVVYGVGSSGTDYAYRTQEDTSITTQHVVIISDLKPSTSYHFSVVSKDQSGNTTKSSDQPILTEQATESVVDVVVKSLQNSIGWIFGAVFGASY